MSLTDAGMLLAQLPPAQIPSDTVTLGEAVGFWILGPLALAGGLGMVLARSAVHSALWLVTTMLSLGALYMAQQAPFLGFVQIIVYTGAVMMLFLFVLMLVGRDSSDSVVEVLRGQRAAAMLGGLGLAVLLVAALARSLTDVTATGLAAQNDTSQGGGNVHSIGSVLFTDYLLPFELTAALLIAATLGAIVLSFSDRSATPRATQRERVVARLRGNRPSPLPGPGVFATASSVAVPALLPDGSVAPESLSEIIEATTTEELAKGRESVLGVHQADAHALRGDGPAATDTDTRVDPGTDEESR